MFIGSMNSFLPTSSPAGCPVTIWLAALLVSFGLPAFAQISVEFSREFQFVEPQTIKPEDGKGFILYREFPYGDREESFTLDLNFDAGNVEVQVYDDKNVQDFGTREDPFLRKSFQRSSQMELPPMRPGGLGITVVPDVIAAQTLRVQMFRHGKVDQKMADAMEPIVAAFPRSLSAIFRMPRIKIVHKPCGVFNAFSDPNITICSELTHQLNELHLDDALQVIEAHELAHSMLKLWGLPGYDNEDMADEFAAAILANSPNAIDAYIAWLEKHDSLSEAAYQLQVGDRHTISIQRARNIREVIKRKDEVLVRWISFLGQHSWDYEASERQQGRKRESTQPQVKFPFEVATMDLDCLESFDTVTKTPDACVVAVFYRHAPDGAHSFFFIRKDKVVVTFGGYDFEGNGESSVLAVTRSLFGAGPDDKVAWAVGRCDVEGPLAHPRFIDCRARLEGGYRVVRARAKSDWQLPKAKKNPSAP